ncbi:hypothetical protein DL768_001116 [Monosporascus sp. mg162]|nr:hypothetical protein DL768_001116 [Monosporascus sp. mg162]
MSKIRVLNSLGLTYRTAYFPLLGGLPRQDHRVCVSSHFSTAVVRRATSSTPPQLAGRVRKYHLEPYSRTATTIIAAEPAAATTTTATTIAAEAADVTTIAAEAADVTTIAAEPWTAAAGAAGKTSYRELPLPVGNPREAGE